MAQKSRAKTKQNGGANLGFEQTLWAAADKLRGHMDAAEYKHVVLGLIFLKYISDAFEEQHAKLSKEKGADPEDRDEYLATNIFWVPPEARWTYLQGRAKDPLIGKLLDNAMVAIERDNPSLKGVLPKNYARPDLNKQQLGEVIDLIAKIGLGDKKSRSKDILGRVYEYFLSQFASAEGKKGGQFYTPRCVVQLLVEMLAPYKGRVFDPCCGSGGMFVQSVRFVKEHATGIYVLIGEDGSVVNDDDTPVVQYAWGKFWVNNHAHVLTGKNGISTEHLLLFLKQVNIRAFVTGAVQPKLNQGNLCRVPFEMPPEPVACSFFQKINPLFASIRTNIEESRTLAALRDALLPKLLSGAVRVSAFAGASARQEGLNV